MKDFQYKGCLIVCLMGLFYSVSVVQGSMAIKPAFIVVRMDQKRPSGMFLISNLGESEERFRVKAMHFTYSEEGALRQSTTGEFSLAPLIRFNPREVVLPPKTQRAVRFAVLPRGKLVEGEHWAAMELESLKVNEIRRGEEDKAMKLRASTSLMVPIFGSMGKVKHQGQIRDISLQAREQGLVIRVLMASVGTGRLCVGGTYEIRDDAGTLVEQGPLMRAYILRQMKRWWTQPIKAKMVPGKNYQVKIVLQAIELKQPFVKEMELVCPLPKSTTQEDYANKNTNVDGATVAHVQESL